MVTTRILGRTSISGRAGTGIIIRRELNVIQRRIKDAVGRRRLSDARSYLASIRGKGSSRQVNQAIEILLSRLVNNPRIRQSSVRQQFLRGVDTTIDVFQKQASKKISAAKRNVQRAAAVNLKSGIKSGSRVTTRTVNGAVYRIGSDGTFERISLTAKRKAQQLRIKKGTATAKDLFAGLNVNKAADRITLLNRAVRAYEGQARIRSSARIMKEGGKNAGTLPSSDIRKIASFLGVSQASVKRQASKLTVADANKLSKSAKKIEKRGAQLTKQENVILSFLKTNIDKEKGKTIKKMSSLPSSVKSLTTPTTNASAKLSKKLAELSVGVGYTPSRVAQAIDKSLFANQAGATALIRGDFRNHVARQLKENNRLSPVVQKSLRQAFKDPSTYLFALIGARTSPKINVKNRPLVINRPVSGSPTALVLKNRVIVDKKTNKLYYVDNQGLVGRLTVKNNRPKITFPKTREFNFKTLGFTSKSQYNKWVKLNEASKKATGKKAQTIEKQIANLENKILNAKNRRALQAEKSRLRNLKKARKARIAGKPPKLTISKAAQKRAALAKSKLKKATVTRKQVLKAGFKNLTEFNKAKRLGFTTKKQVNAFQKLAERAAKGDKKADKRVLAQFVKVSRTKAAARRKAATLRSETLRLKSQILKARKGRRSTQKGTNQLIQKVKVLLRGNKKAQGRILTLDQALFKIRAIKSRATRVSPKLRLRSARNLNLPKYRFTLKRSVVVLLSNKTKAQYKQLQVIPEVITPAFETQFRNLIRDIIKDIIANVPKQGSRNRIFNSYRLVQKVAAKPAKRTRKPVRAVKKVGKKAGVKLKIKLPFRTDVKNPKGFNAWVKTRTGWKKANPKPLTKANASKVARYVVDNSLAATFYVAGTTAKAVKRKITIDGLKRYFRPSKSKRVPKGSKVEKRKHRLNTRSEKRKIRVASLIAKLKKKL